MLRKINFRPFVAYKARIQTHFSLLSKQQSKWMEAGESPWATLLSPDYLKWFGRNFPRFDCKDNCKGVQISGAAVIVLRLRFFVTFSRFEAQSV